MEEEAGVEDEDAGVEEEEIGGTSSSSMSRVWLRGPSTLPRRLIPLERRPLIRHDGDKLVTLYVITNFSFDMFKIIIEINNLS